MKTSKRTLYREPTTLELSDAGRAVKEILGAKEIPISNFAAELFYDTLTAIMRNTDKK